MGLAHRGKKNQNTGRSRGGLTSKIHTLCDALGNPLKFIVTPGQDSDYTQAKVLLENVDGEYVIADKGYDADHIVGKVKEIGAEAVIPPRSNRLRPRAYDHELYKERNIIERLFNKMKHFRRFSTRYDKLSINFEAFVCFIAAFLWIK
jgi:transposase